MEFEMQKIRPTVSYAVAVFNSSEIYRDYGNLDLRNRRDSTEGSDYLIVKVKAFRSHDKHHCIILGLKLYYLRS